MMRASVLERLFGAFPRLAASRAIRIGNAMASTSSGWILVLPAMTISGLRWSRYLNLAILHLAGLEHGVGLHICPFSALIKGKSICAFRVCHHSLNHLGRKVIAQAHALVLGLCGFAWESRASHFQP